jgi:chorismate mutase/prephenate dehydrogenase
MAPNEIEALRARIQKVDVDLIALAAERVAVARLVGEAKRRAGLPTVDFVQERAVYHRAREEATRRRLDPGVAETLMAEMIRASLTAQEEDHLRAHGTGSGRVAVLVGGAGRMGGWFARFLEGQGFTVGILDPRAEASEREWAASRLPDADLVVMSVPPGATVAQYRAWRDSPPPGILVDISSIKTPLLEPIAGLRRAGARVASIHPMFGPATTLLRDADVVLCDTGDDGSTDAVAALFAATSARLVRVALADHDRIMADLLSLAHATAISFAAALPRSEHPVRSTTFQSLEALAAAVVRESPDVYFEIQADNPYSVEAIDRLRAVLDRLARSVRERDRDGFAELLHAGRAQTGAEEASEGGPRR